MYQLGCSLVNVAIAIQLRCDWKEVNGTPGLTGHGEANAAPPVRYLALSARRSKLSLGGCRWARALNYSNVKFTNFKGFTSMYVACNTNVD